MAIIQMWPQNRGLRNSISFNGRTYSSIPGVPIPVPDFDVAVLQANGWTTYATTAGKTTITMLPPANAVHNSITFNGRTYVTTPGVPIEVHPFDAPVLQANGWGLVQLTGATPVNAAVPTITGTAQVGQTLTASNGTWANSPTGFAYQWQREGSNIGGATSQTYLLAAADLGALVDVVVTASNGAGSSLPAISALAGPVISTTVFYVSSSTGNDANAGTSPGAPWQTLTKVNGASLSPGTSVLFKRGDTWRDGSGGTLSGLKTARLNCQSGTNGNPIVYDAYGTGANPRFLGSVDASSTGNWTNTSGNIWTSNLVFQPTGGNGNGQPVENANDVGLVTWGSYPNRTVGSMVDLPGQSDASLTTQGKWLFNTTDWKVHIFSVGNPATAMPGLELGVDADMINALFKSDVVIQNISMFNGAGHGIAYGGPSNRVTIRDCIVGWMGGGNLNGGGTRYGNGTQISGGGTFCTVERNWIFECFDGGITQEDFSNTNITFDNLTYRNNVVYNCPVLIELNLGAQSGNVMKSIFCYNNTCPNPAGNTNRPAGNGNNHISLNPSGVVPTVAFKVMNNSFTYAVIGMNIQNYTWGQGLAEWDYNNWVMTNPVHSGNPALDTLTISQWAAAYSPAAETHGLLQVAPQYIDYTLGGVAPNNLAPATGSPLFNAGTNLFSAGVVWDFNKKPRPATGPFTIGAFQQ